MAFALTILGFLVSTHSRPKAAASGKSGKENKSNVSTHSRPKAAAVLYCRTTLGQKCFNTQPPEGGCGVTDSPASVGTTVSTHSRPKAAAKYRVSCTIAEAVFQHTAARRRLLPT